MSISVRKVNDTIVSKSVLPSSTPLPSKVDKPEQSFEEAQADILGLKACMNNQYFTNGKLVSRVQANRILRDKISLQDFERPDVVKAKVAAIAAQYDYEELRRTPAALTLAQQNAESKALYQDSAAEVFNIASQKYHIAFDARYGGRMFIRRRSDKNFLVFMKKDDCPFGGDKNVVGAVTNSGLIDLSKEEFEEIKTKQPTFETLMNAYVLCFQDNITFTNMNNPTIVL